MAAPNVMGNNGYGSFADPKHQGREVSGCLEQEANAKEFNLFTKASLLSDPVAVDLNIIQSQGPGYYTMENTYGCGCACCCICCCCPCCCCAAPAICWNMSL